MKLFQLIILALALVTSFQSDAQIRHVRGIRSIDSYYLTSRYGSGAGLSYTKYFSNSLYAKGTAFYEQGKDSGLSYRSTGGEISLARTVLHHGHFYYLNLVGGCVVSLDAVTKGGESYEISNQMKIGGMAGIENELFINDKFVLLLNWNQRIVVKQQFGNYRWFGQIGIRYNF